MERDTLNINPLLQLCIPLFQMIATLRSKERGAELSADYGEKLKQAVDQLERNAFSQQIPQFSVQNIKYAMSAFVDELVLNSKWEGRNKWMAQPLQLQYFGEHVAGEGFFKRLSDLRQAGTQYVDVLEVYYMCLQLGFEGMYRLRGLEQLLALQVDLRSQIEMMRGVVNPRLADDALPERSFVAKVGNKLPFWVIASVTLAIIFFIYLGYAIAVNHQADKVEHQVKSERSQLIQGFKGGNSD